MTYRNVAGEDRVRPYVKANRLLQTGYTKYVNTMIAAAT